MNAGMDDAAFAYVGFDNGIVHLFVIELMGRRSHLVLWPVSHKTPPVVADGGRGRVLVAHTSGVAYEVM